MSASEDPQAEVPPANDEPTTDAAPEKDGKPQVIIKSTSCLCGTHEPTYNGTVVKFSGPHSDEELFEFARRLCRTVPGIGNVTQSGNDTIVIEQHELLGTGEDARTQAKNIARELGVDPADIQEDLDDLSRHDRTMIAAALAVSIFGSRSRRQPPRSIWDILNNN